MIAKIKTRKDRSKGFTLIELLVVIAIIALLVSILMPSLDKAKVLARKAVCMTNLRSLSTAFAMYAAENTERWPAHSACTGEERYDSWVPSGDPQGWVGWDDYDLTRGALYPYLETVEIFQCPQWQADKGAYAKLDYSQNVYVFFTDGSTEDYYDYVAIDRVDDPANMVNLVDHGNCNDGDFSPYWDFHYRLINGSAGGLEYQHGGYQNLTHMDGHIESVSQDELETGDYRFTYGRPWYQYYK